MEVIFKNDTLRQIVGGNIKDVNKGYTKTKYSRFCVKLNVNDGVLLFNSLIGMMVYFSNEEFNAIKTNYEHLSFLYSNFFIINEGDDDYIESLSDKVQTFIRTHKKVHTFDKVTTVTILPSTGCNAKCFYCFEKGALKKHMDYDTADKVIDFITQRYNGKMLKVKWFGGEPLINEKIITYISEKLTEKGINYDSSITSNCFLIDESKIDLYKNTWKLKRVSVTIDGTETIYNNTKAFTYSGSAYKKVLNNVEMLANNGLRVSIRINIGAHNIEDVELLVNELSERFKEHKRVSIYLNRIYENCEGAPEDKESLSVVYKKIFEMTTLLSKTGKSVCRLSVNKPFKTFYCMSDSGNAVMILPDGKIGLCEHYMDDYHIGDVVNGITNNENVRLCCEQVDKHDTCKKCILYPTCGKLKVCAGGGICGIEELDYLLYFIKKSMLKEYRKYEKTKNRL